MEDDNKERLNRRLLRYRQHHDASQSRFDNYCNSVCEQQREDTRALHRRWLESRPKKVKIIVADEVCPELTLNTFDQDPWYSQLTATSASTDDPSGAIKEAHEILGKSDAMSASTSVLATASVPPVSVLVSVIVTSASVSIPPALVVAKPVGVSSALLPLTTVEDIPVKNLQKSKSANLKTTTLDESSQDETGIPELSTPSDTETTSKPVSPLADHNTPITVSCLPSTCSAPDPVISASVSLPPSV